MDAIQGERIQALEEQIEMHEDAIDRLTEIELEKIQKGEPIILGDQECTFTDIISEQFDDQFIVLMHMAYIEMKELKSKPAPHMKRFFDAAEELIVKACRDAALTQTGYYE